MVSRLQLGWLVPAALVLPAACASIVGVNKDYVEDVVDAAPPADGPAPDVAPPDAEGPALLQARAIAAGDYHACVIVEDGAVACWGAHVDGELGAGNVAVPYPVRAQLNEPASAIAAGGAHACAIASSGTLYCWGRDTDSQLGDLGTAPRAFPTPVKVAPLASRVAAGEAHTCAVALDGGTGALDAAGGALGRVVCWGSDDSGQRTGSGLPLGTPARTVAAGAHHSCAIQGNADVQCWGDDTLGQLGDGKTNQSHIGPESAQLPLAAVEIALGAAHTCALLDAGNGDVYCWGDNAFGQVAVSPAGSPVTRAAKVQGLPDGGIAHIGAGAKHTCAIAKADGRLYCWGRGAEGQLGDGRTDTSRETPSPISLDAGFVAVSGGVGYTCAIATNGSVWCWGDNSTGQLATRSEAGSAVPLNVQW